MYNSIATYVLQLKYSKLKELLTKFIYTLLYCMAKYVCTHTHIHTHTHTHTAQDVMEEWALCQRSWLYLEPIFSSEDIMQQLPVEGKRYQTMDRIWKKTMANAHQDPKV